MFSIEFFSRRSPVYGKGGMVASSQPLATAAGLEILSRGGNAADAAIAAAAALNVTEPCSTGLGGDMFALFYDAQSGQVSALNGSGRAPAALTLERVRQGGWSVALPPFHPYTVTVPGACAGWCDLHERHGALSLQEILAPAIRLAEEGFPVAPLTAYFWQRGAERQLRNAFNGQELTIEGRAPRAGEVFHNPGLARTLQQIAEDGKTAFYQGAIAEAIVEAVQQSGGCMSLDDLAAHTSTWETPASIPFGAYRVYECPPNGQGIAALLAFNLLEGFDLTGFSPLSVERLHLEIEALRLAFADARRYVADPAFGADWQWMLSKDYAAKRRQQIDPRHATLDREAGRPIASSDTVYLCAVDRWGNACSFINSNYMGFGTGIVPKGWGFSLQNRGHNFHLDPAHPNRLQPRKRPYHTIIPGLITRLSSTARATDNRPATVGGLSSARQVETLFAPFGVMGGFMQPQGHVQVGLALMLDGLDPQSALDLPRFCLEDGNPSDAVALEEGIPVSVMSTLAEMGHPVRPVSGWGRAMFGRGQVILREPNGVLIGGSDPRADGCAMTLP